MELLEWLCYVRYLLVVKCVAVNSKEMKWDAGWGISLRVELLMLLLDYSY
jgi:hypothetical protein